MCAGRVHTSEWPPGPRCHARRSLQWARTPTQRRFGWPVRKRLPHHSRSRRRLSRRRRRWPLPEPPRARSSNPSPKSVGCCPDEAGRKPCPGCRWSDLGTARLGTQSSRRRNTRPAWRCRNRSERGPHRADAMDRWHRFQPDQSWDVFDS